MTRSRRDLVVVGASAGGVEALCGLAAGLPADLGAAVLVVLHLPAGGRSALAAILNRSGPLPAHIARHGQAITDGHIHVAPPDRHLLMVDGRIELSHGPTENGWRPSINALFRSATVAAGPRVTGVLLSGVLDDGVAGLVAIASRGGQVMVQDPREALFPSMPNLAMSTLPVDHVLPVADMGATLAKLSTERVHPDDLPAPPDLMRLENDIARAETEEQERAGSDRLERMGRFSGFTCPDCGGPLLEIEPSSRYRCRVGHAWTADALLGAHDAAFDRALRIAIRTLDEKADLSTRMADRARDRGTDHLAARYRETAGNATDAADVLRDSLMRDRTDRTSSS
jgi:two-component system, chemotaxis family, protein-glutamate methylesterase/glutaminase